MIPDLMDAPSWQGRQRFVIFDAHYGDGSRFAALLRRWRDDPARPQRLHYIALDPDCALPGSRRVPGHGDAVTLDLLGAPASAIDAALGQLRTHLDFAILHRMAGAGERFARALERMAAPGMSLSAQGLTAAQLRALEANSFALTGDGDGWRGVCTSRRPFVPVAAQADRRAIVIGAGLAGSAACQRLVARGWQVTLVERHPHPAQEASGNLAGIVMPLLSRDDNVMTRLARAGFLYARDYWDALGGPATGARCGVLQLARDGEHAAVQRAIAAEQSLPGWFARWLERDEAAALLQGTPAPHGAWLFPQGGWVHPPGACGAMLSACGAALVRRFACASVSLERNGDGWAVRRSDGGLVAAAPVVIVAGGAFHQIAQAAALPLNPTRGQVSHLAAGSIPALPFVLCREAYLTPAVRGWHSSGATYDDDGDPALRQSSHDANLARLRAMLGDPQAAPHAPLAGRVGFRSVSPDRLPLVGVLPDHGALHRAPRMERLREVPRHPGLYGLLGFASRGLTWAPLAAELLAAQLDGEPLPVEAELADALDPARFLLRERRRNGAFGPAEG